MVKAFMDSEHPYWPWCRVYVHNVQANRISRLEQTRGIAGGFGTSVNQPGLYHRFLTKTALKRIGK